MRNKGIWLIALLLAFVGCYEDKGNYDYSENNSITIDLRNTKYLAVAGETITIEPIFTFALDSNETGLTYEWTLGGKFLTDKRNLSYYVDTILREQCILRVLDTKSNITYMATVAFELTEKHNVSGWMILSENEGNSWFSFIRESVAGSSYNYVEYPNAYEQENHVALGGRPVKLLEHFYYSCASSSTWVLLDGAESVDLSGLSLKKEMTLSESFLDKQLPANFSPKEMVEMRWVSAVINKNDGKVYTRKKISDKSFYTGFYLNTPLTYEDQVLHVTDFVIAPFMGPGYTLMVEGQRGHQRYLALVDKDKNNAGKVLPLTVNVNYPDGFSKLDNLGEMEVVYTGYYRGADYNRSNVNVYCSILKSVAGEYFFQEFSIAKMSSTNSVIATPLRQVKFDIAHLVDENTIFNISPYLGSTYVMIAHGRDLYYVNRVTIGSAGMLLTPYLPKPNTPFAANITAMDSENYESARLGVGLENGQFYVLNMKTNEGLNDVTKRLVYEIQTPVGKIKDVRFKIKSGNNWPR